MRVFENRASFVLYCFLKSNTITKPFLLPANVCPIVPLTFIKAGVAFEFIDIDKTHGMNQQMCLDRLKTRNYNGVLFVHAYGRSFENADFYALIKSVDPSIYIVDDRCLCIPRLDSKVQENVDLELYSTGYAKYVDLLYGGWGIIHDGLNYEHFLLEYKENDFEEEMSYVRKCLETGLKYEKNTTDWLDGNSLNSIQIYLEQVEEKLALVNAHKKRINSIYEYYLSSYNNWGKEYQVWRFILEIENRDICLKKIFDAGLFAGTNFPSVAFLFAGKHLPFVEREQNRILNLFNDFRVDEKFAQKVCKIITACNM